MCVCVLSICNPRSVVVFGVYWLGDTWQFKHRLKLLSIIIRCPLALLVCKRLSFCTVSSSGDGTLFFAGPRGDPAAILSPSAQTQPQTQIPQTAAQPQAQPAKSKPTGAFGISMPDYLLQPIPAHPLSCLVCFCGFLFYLSLLPVILFRTCVVLFVHRWWTDCYWRRCTQLLFCDFLRFQSVMNSCAFFYDRVLTQCVAAFGSGAASVRRASSR